MPFASWHAFELHRHHDTFAFLLILVGLPILALRWRYSASDRVIIDSASSFFGILALAVSAFVCAAYLAHPGLNDQTAPTVVTIAQALPRHLPLYPSPDRSGLLYGFIFGPVVYEVQEFFLYFGPSIFLAKLPGVVGCVLTVALLLKIFRTQALNARFKFLLIAFYFLIGLPYGSTLYYVRPDPELILCTAAALASFVFFPPLLAAVAIGTVAGLAMGLKIHAVLYILPVAVALVVGAKDISQGAMRIAIGLSCFMIAGAAPYLHPSASMGGYYAILSRVAQFSMSGQRFAFNIFLAGVLAVPAMIALWSRSLSLADKAFAISLLGCMLIVSIIAAKGELAPSHLLPFLPLTLYWYGVLIKTGDTKVALWSDGPRVVSACFVLVSMGYLAATAFAVTYTASVLKTYPVEQAKANEVKTLYATYHDAVMGITTENGGDLEYRVFGIWQGSPLLLDYQVINDMELAGLSNAVADHFVERCEIRHWIIPKDGPEFSNLRGYPPSPMFSDKFRAAFKQNYKMEREGAYYNVWGCPKT